MANMYVRKCYKINVNCAGFDTIHIVYCRQPQNSPYLCIYFSLSAECFASLCLSHLFRFVGFSSVVFNAVLLQRALPRANYAYASVRMSINVLQNVGLLPKTTINLFLLHSLTLYNSYILYRNLNTIHSLVCMCMFGRLNWNCERPALCMCVDFFAGVLCCCFFFSRFVSFFT